MDWYTEQEQRLGLTPLQKDGPLVVEVAGEASTVDAALSFLLRLWSLRPCSTVEWMTVDGGVPQPDEPARARCLMCFSEHVRDLGQAPKSGDSGPSSRADLSVLS